MLSDSVFAVSFRISPSGCWAGVFYMCLSSRDSSGRKSRLDRVVLLLVSSLTGRYEADSVGGLSCGSITLSAAVHSFLKFLYSQKRW